MRNTICLSLLLLTFTTTAFAENKDAKASPNMPTTEQMEMWKKASTPKEEHETLQRLVGKWDAKSSWWMTATSEPEVSSGTAEFLSMYDKRFVQQTFKGTSMGQPFEGTGILGYDNVKSQFNSIWFDSMTTAIISGKGELSKDKTAVIDTGSFSCPQAPTGTMDYRAVWTLPTDNAFSYEMFVKGEDGKEFRMMKINYTKAK